MQREVEFLIRRNELYFSMKTYLAPVRKTLLATLEATREAEREAMRENEQK